MFLGDVLSLFRSEVLEARKQKLHGDVFLTSPLSFKLITALLAILIIAVLIVLFTGSYARTERVPGYLVPSGGLVKIQAGRFGTLRSLNVTEGDSVQAGDILLSIEAAQLTDSNVSVEERSLLAIREQRQNIKNQIVLEENQLASEQSRMKVEMSAIELEISSLQSQIMLQRDITTSAKTAYADVQELLGKGYISKAESERRRQTWLSQQAQGKLREQEFENAKARLEQLIIRLAHLPAETKARIARLNTQLIDTDTREAELLGREAYAIKAPVSGRIASITTSTIGQSVLPQQPILTILPEGSELAAELFVPSRAVGFVEAGQEVRLLYAAFPYQRFGSFPAEIKKVTKTILSPSETVTPFQLQEPVYRVTASLQNSTLDIAGHEIVLQSGMQLEANIILEDRSFIDWILEPLKAIRGR
jgi:membrane fusion protein